MQHQNTYIVLKKITFLLTNYTDIDLYYAGRRNTDCLARQTSAESE